MFDLINNEVPNVQDTYPPYDIERTGDESFRISVALLGFTPEQITVTVQQNRLTVAGKKKNEDRLNYVFRSISARAFERHFSLADYVQVEGATFVRKVPEAMKPRRIKIGTSLPSDKPEKPEYERVRAA
jgi:molecular chaperone IbpA